MVEVEHDPQSVRVPAQDERRGQPDRGRRSGAFAAPVGSGQDVGVIQRLVLEVGEDDAGDAGGAKQLGPPGQGVEERLPGYGLHPGGVGGKERLGEQLGQPISVELVAGGGEGVEERLDPDAEFRYVNVAEWRSPPSTTGAAQRELTHGRR